MRRALADADGGCSTWADSLARVVYSSQHRICIHPSKPAALPLWVRCQPHGCTVAEASFSTSCAALPAELELPMKDLEEAWLGGTKQASEAGAGQCSVEAP